MEDITIMIVSSGGRSSPFGKMWERVGKLFERKGFEPTFFVFVDNEKARRFLMEVQFPIDVFVTDFQAGYGRISWNSLLKLAKRVSPRVESFVGLEHFLPNNIIRVKKSGARSLSKRGAHLDVLEEIVNIILEKRLAELLLEN